MPLTVRRLTRMRLAAQRLVGAGFADAPSAVRALGAVQSQDCAGALWALGMRIPGATQVSLGAAFDRGEILRTHVLRPTWHFVAPEDIRWMVTLTGPRILSVNSRRLRELALDAKALARAMKALQRGMVGSPGMTRAEVRALLAGARVEAADTERFTHVMMLAELDGIVTSGARKGAQSTTYALLDERAPASPPRARDDAVRELVRRYFTSHGPATLHDFVVWSSLTMADARRALDELGDAFTSDEMDGLRWWYASDAPAPAARAAGAHLLPNYDEYFIGFRHRAPLGVRIAGHPNSIFAHAIEVDGQIVGAWKRVAAGRRAVVELDPAVPLTTMERASVEREVARYGRFVGMEVEWRW